MLPDHPIRPLPLAVIHAKDADLSPARKALRHEAARWEPATVRRVDPRYRTTARRMRALLARVDTRDMPARMRIPKGMLSCGLPRGHDVPLHAAPATDHKGRHRPGIARSLTQCRNRWWCPYCSMTWRHLKAQETAAVVRHLMAQGHRMAYTSMTMPHQSHQSLAELLTRLTTAWRHVTKQAGRRPSMLRTVGAHYWLRIIDLPVAGLNGPHPHFEVIHTIHPDAIIDQGGKRFGVRDPRDPTQAHLLGLGWAQGLKVALTMADLEALPGHLTSTQEVLPDTLAGLTDYAFKADKAGYEAWDQVHKSATHSIRPIRLLATYAHTANPTARAEAERLITALVPQTYRRKAFASSLSPSWSRLAQKVTGHALAEDDDIEALHAQAEGYDPEPFALIPGEVYTAMRPEIERILDRMARHPYPDSIRYATAELTNHGIPWYPPPGHDIG